MTEKETEPSAEEANFNRAMRALAQVSKSEIEELEKREPAKAHAGSAADRRK